ncbi:hypothetical protein EXIGLDRAFT_491304 [Exidia glandulosa HHB12029]|uniref:Uncharacterized protein n=1 Tax=Exidia glandulosa HHB12029 TaxID=1314781 RepID=A0A165Z384_EXIGL|nr:hypothetical protein EXIGLDRAFT_491304 [Exidia glandulosa HHB12029]
MSSRADSRSALVVQSRMSVCIPILGCSRFKGTARWIQAARVNGKRPAIVYEMLRNPVWQTCCSTRADASRMSICIPKWVCMLSLAFGVSCGLCALGMYGLRSFIPQLTT